MGASSPAARQAAGRARLRRAGAADGRHRPRGERNIIALLPASSGARLLVAADHGRGFVGPKAEVVAETRKGRGGGDAAAAGPYSSLSARSAPSDDCVGAVGDNRKLLVFPLAEVAELARGQGVQLQRYRDGGLSDARRFGMAEGLSWAMGGEGGPDAHRNRPFALARRARRGGADGAQWLSAE